MTTNDHDAEGSWASSMLWVVSTALSPDEISRRLGRENWQRWPTRYPPSRTTWVADFAPDDQVPHGEQLDAVERFLAEKADVLEELASTCEITLRLGWSPEGAEETGVIIGPSLAGLLHRVGASVVIRVFTGPDA